MTRILAAVLAALSFAALATTPASPYRDTLPDDRELRQGQVVFVDDGKCPTGEVKEITGGSRAKAIARTVRCVPRPADWPDKSPAKSAK